MPDFRKARKESVSAVTSLGRLVARMALDEGLHRAYLDDEEKVISASGLSEQEAAALRSGDWPAILRLLGPDDRGGMGDAERDPGGG